MGDIHFTHINSDSDSDMDLEAATHTRSRLTKLLASYNAPHDYYRKLFLKT